MLITGSKEIADKVIEAIKTVKDPEMDISLYDFGIIYEVNVGEDNHVGIVATFTAPNCPEADYIMGELKTAIEGVEGVKDCLIEITFDPVWNPDMMTEEGRLITGL